jgi:hypothetical protein
MASRWGELPYPDRDLTADSLEGEAYDSLFKALCAKAALKSSEGRQVFAPFAFISALAGALLAIETVRRLSGESPTFNLWKISPWSPFLTKLQRQISANPSCVVCGSSIYRQVTQQVWS